MTDKHRDTLIFYTARDSIVGGTVLDGHRNPVDAHTGMRVQDAVNYLHQRGKSIDVEFHPLEDRQH